MPRTNIPEAIKCKTLHNKPQRNCANERCTIGKYLSGAKQHHHSQESRSRNATTMQHFLEMEAPQEPREPESTLTSISTNGPKYEPGMLNRQMRHQVRGRRNKDYSLIHCHRPSTEVLQYRKSCTRRRDNDIGNNDKIHQEPTSSFKNDEDEQSTGTISNDSLTRKTVHFANDVAIIPIRGRSYVQRRLAKAAFGVENDSWKTI